MLLTSLSVFVGLLAYRGPLAAAATTSTNPQLPLSVPLVDIPAVCMEIASSVSAASSVFFPGSAEYAKDISHYSLLSTQESACSFEPGTPEDVGIALQILGRTRCPFAVKSGGHAMNPGFSSTPGVQIALYRFSNVTYNSATQTVEVGAGLYWDDVYTALEPYGVNVVGGRVSGVGVGGFTLGGGYSWHTNQYGLTSDTVEVFELVLPNGTITKVNASQEDLYFGLKGGLNNFGIVTKFTFKTFPQTQVWGGTIIYDESQLDRMIKATAKFAANNTDPKANIVAAYTYIRNNADQGIRGVLALFYDDPSPPAGLFDDFLSNSSHTMVFTRSFMSLIQSPNTELLARGLRSTFHTISVLGYPEGFLRYIVNETIYWGTKLPKDDGHVTFMAEPFLSNVYSHNTTPSAWPGSRAFFSPLGIDFAWKGDGSTDKMMLNALKQSASNLRVNAHVPEQASLYVNYASFDTSLEMIYGDNLERLKSIARKVDPQNVMGLAGGFNF